MIRCPIKPANIIAVCLSALIMVLHANVRAENGGAGPDISFEEEAAKARDEISSSADIIDPEVRQAWLDARLAYYERLQTFYTEDTDYIVNVLQLRQDTYEWHIFSTRIIFWVVIILVVIGAIFSAWEFYQGGKNGEATFKLSKEGIQFSSNVVGVIILFISLLFFYLYLTEVYHLREVNTDLDKSAMSEVVDKEH